MMTRKLENRGSCKKRCRLVWHGHLARESWAGRPCHKRWCERLPVVLAGFLVLSAGCGREPEPPVPEAPPVDRIEPEARRPVAPQPGETFDHAAHEDAMRRLAPVHHARMAVVREAARERADYEASMRKATPERRAIAEEIDALKDAVAAHEARIESIFMADAELQRLRADVREVQGRIEILREPVKARLDADPDALARDAAIEGELAALQDLGRTLRERREAVESREADLQWMNPDAKAAAEALETKRARIAEAEARWRETFADDPAWREFDERAQAAERERDAVRRELVSRIQTRMRHDAARRQVERETAPETRP